MCAGVLCLCMLQGTVRAGPSAGGPRTSRTKRALCGRRSLYACCQPAELMPPKGWVQHQPPRQQLPSHHQLTNCMAGVGWPASRTYRKLHACPAVKATCVPVTVWPVACAQQPPQVDTCCTVLSPPCLQVAEMVQHLELCPILGVACSAYAQKPHLLQVSRRQALHG